MAIEIERKFLLKDRAWWTPGIETSEIRQFYLDRRDDLSVRIRIVDEKAAFLTIKTGMGMSRGEFEYEIPLQDAVDLEAARIGICIAKRRHRLPHGEQTIEIDVFSGDLAPLVVAEIELKGEAEPIALPAYFGREITGDAAYSNARLALFGKPDDFDRP